MSTALATCNYCRTQRVPVDKALLLHEARQLILEFTPRAKAEKLLLHDALKRRPTENLKASMPVPHFAQSTRDGFAVRLKGRQDKKNSFKLQVSGEIAAGCTTIPLLGRNQAIRIMTGGAVPTNADRVIPLEWCQEANGRVEIFKQGTPGSHIKRKGADLKKGHVIIRRGEEISPLHLHLLATSGTSHVEVFSRPRVAFLCTGSELVEKSPLPGQILSGNRALLHGLISQAGGEPEDLGMVMDETGALADTLHKTGQPDILITTGGMGPGKYDLMETVLEKVGMRILYRQLHLRPGRSTIFGVQKNMLVFALPGPPPAVHTLFQELIRPAIIAFQGGSPQPHKAHAILLQDIFLRKEGILNLKNGRTAMNSEKLTVKPTSSSEPANASILVPGSRKHLRKGEKVTVHLYL